MKLSVTEENYLKAIYVLFLENGMVSTKDIATKMNTQPPSVTEMIKKLADKKIVEYIKYQGVKLSKQGHLKAVSIIRKHRIWEVFLYEKLKFKWDEVHQIAEQLEHIHSEKLIDNLDAFLGYPKTDPHGDPIPEKNGNIDFTQQILLSETQIGNTYDICKVQESDSSFLIFLENKKLLIDTQITILQREKFDNSIIVQLKDKSEVYLSLKMCKNIYVKKLKG